MPGLEELQMIQQMAGNIGTEAISGLKFFKGLSDEKKDKAALAALHRPFYKIQDEYFQNRNISAEQAGQGRPTDTLNFMTEEQQRGLGTGIAAINSGGGDPNEVARLLEGYNRNLRAIGAADAATHQKNIEYFMKANADVAAQKTMQWSINEFQPYEAKLKELKQNVAVDEANKWGGLTSFVGSLIGAGAANQNKGLMNKLFTKGSNSLGQIPDPYTYTPPVQQVRASPNTASNFSLAPTFNPSGMINPPAEMNVDQFSPSFE